MLSKPKYIKPKHPSKLKKKKVIPEGVVMSKIGQKKKICNWESSCARCENCLHFKDKHIYLIDSLPRETVRHCDKYGFRTNLNSICDDWVDKVTKLPCEVVEKPFSFAAMGSIKGKSVSKS